MKTRSLITLATVLALSAGLSALAPSAAESPAQSPVASNLTFDAHGLPVFKPGLWDVVDEDGDGQKVCLGAGLTDDLREQLFTQREECTRNVDRSGGALKVSGTCVKDGMQISANATIVGDQTQHVITLRVGFVRAGQAPIGHTMTMRSRWLSACPAGMQQGDILQEEDPDE